MKHAIVMKTTNIKIFALILMTLFMSVQTIVWAEDVTPSVTLTTYYSAANGKSSDALRTALQGIIDDHTVVGYSSLGTLMQYSDTEEANGTDVIDIYSTCTFTVSGALTWGSTGTVGAAMNREHTVPQSWFNEASPMVSDAFHIYPTDCKANNNRSSYLYGEFSAAGTSYSSSSCAETGKLSGTGTKTIASYTYNGTTYSPTATYSGQVYEPSDEFKGDIARGYFYMATRYAGVCSEWSGGAFGSDNNGLKNYTAELMLKWHRQDPVSRKELIRNEVIYGNTKYNKSNKKQGNRNPFIDYPELVEYIWGDKKNQSVSINNLTSGYAEAGTVTPTTTYNVTLWRNGNTQVVSGQTGTYNLPAKNNEADACDNWAFDGWSTAKVSETTTKPSYVSSVNSASTVYAVYAKTESSGSAPHRATMADTQVTFTPGTDTGETSVTKSGVTCSMTTMNNSSYYQIYANQSGTFTCSSGNIVKIEFTCTASGTSKYGPGNASANVGSYSYSGSKGTWTGSASSVTISSTAQVRMSSLSVTYSGGSTTTTYYASEPEDCNCSGQLPTPVVTATPSDGAITLTWSDVAGATSGYSVTIDKGVGYTTECGDVEIGEVTHSGSTNTCVITGLVNGLSYTTSVVANGTTATCESDAGTATTTPVGCSSWDITFGYSTYTLTAGGATVSPTISGTTHGTVIYESSNTSVLTVNESGVVTPVSPGTATVTAHWAGDGSYCPKDVTSSTFTVNGKVTVTFDKNDGSSTTTTQQVDYNTPTTLTANTFSRTGYTFLGWATEASGAKVYDDGASITVTAATTLYAVWQVNSHNVSFSKPTGASNLTVNSVTTSPKSVNYGSTVNIVVTPAAHYSVGSVTADGGVTVTGSGNNWSFTMPDNDVTITVTMVEDTKYTVNWYVAGTPTEEVNYAGEALAGISDPTIDCNGKVFMGWTATADYSDATTAPADLFTDASTKTMPSNNSTNYYAVFATRITSGNGSASVTDEITLSSTGASGSTYSNWSDLSLTSSAVYSGNNAGGNSSIQLRTNNSNSGIVSTASGGNIKKVVIEWNDNTSSGRSVDVYGSNSAYTEASNLYVTASQGMLLGSLSVDNNDTELNVTGDYRYIGIRSHSGALYLNSVEFTWSADSGGGTTTCSDYSTSCSAPVLYEIAISDPEHGAITTSPSGTAVSGSTVTITITPDAGYNLATLTVEDENESPVNVNGDGNTRTFVMPESDVTISATFVEKQKYTINFYVEGTLASSQNVYEGSAPDVPSSPAPCDGGYTFAGWWTSTLNADNTTAQTLIADFTATQARDYYAVFSYSEAGGSSGSKTIDFTTTGWDNESQHTTVTDDPITITVAGGGNNGKYYTSDKTWRMYSGGSIAIACASGDITAVTSNPSQEFTISNGVATLAFSASVRFKSITVSYSGVGTTYYTTSTCSTPEPIMMVSGLDGAYFAVTHDVNDSAIAALELIGVNDTYYYKPGTNIADITWYIQRGRASNYLSNSAGLYLAVEGKNIAMQTERFAWSVNDNGQFVTADNTGLCYDSKNSEFVVADKSGNDANNWHLSVSAAGQSLDILLEAAIYTRSGVTDGQYITICLPFAVSQAFLETAEVYNVTGKFVTDNKVTGIALMPEEGILEAGKPYVVHTLSSPLNAYYGEITATEAISALGLVGNLSEEPLAVPAGCYGLSNSRLRLVTEGGRATTGQYKAYFDLRDVPEVSSTTLPMGSKMMYTTDTAETPTDVNPIFGNPAEINWQLPVYNVLGIRVGEDATGVLIQNGIKFLKY